MHRNTTIDRILKELIKLGSDGYIEKIERKIAREEREIREHQENIRTLKSQLLKPL